MSSRLDSVSGYIPLNASLRDCLTPHQIGLRLLQVTAGLCLVLLIVHLFNDRIVQPAFHELELSQAVEDNNHAFSGITGELNTLSALAGDWASWDEAYGFAQTRSEAFVKANYPRAASLSLNSRIDLLAMYNLAGNCLLQGVYHPAKQRQVELALFSGPEPPIVTRLSEVLDRATDLDGLVASEHGLLLLVARPILTTDKQGPPQGVLVMGRFLTDKDLHTLSDRTGVDMTLLPCSNLRLTEAKLFGRLAALGSDRPLRDGDNMYRLLRGMDHAPLAMLRTPVRGEIRELGQRTGILVSTLLAAIAFALLFFFGLYRCRIRLVRQVLQESASRYRQLFEGEPDAILLVDNADGRILEANQAATLLYRYGKHELLAMHNFELSAEPEETQRINRIPAHSGEVIAIPSRWHRKKDGTIIPVEITSRFFEYQGKVVQLASIRDISERTRKEAERAELENLNRQLQKEESLGRMAAAISHHFNNQLMVVMGFIQFAMDNKLNPVQCSRDLDQAMQAAGRAADISNLIRTYLGQTTSPRLPLDLAEVCQRHLAGLRQLIPAGVDLQIRISTPGPVVVLNVKQIRQVLTNLVTNSIESLADRAGWIKVGIEETAAVDIPEWRRFPTGWKPTRSRYACLSVTDSGCGIEARYMEKLFDPFFTSKFTGRGLGLSVSLGLVRAHDGAIVVDSAPGRGCVFRVFLPLSEEEPVAMTDFNEELS